MFVCQLGLSSVKLSPLSAEYCSHRHTHQQRAFSLRHSQCSGTSAPTGYFFSASVEPCSLSKCSCWQSVPQVYLRVESGSAAFEGFAKLHLNHFLFKWKARSIIPVMLTQIVASQVFLSSQNTGRKFTVDLHLVFMKDLSR